MSTDAQQIINELLDEFDEIDKIASELLNTAEILSLSPDIDPDDDYFSGIQSFSYKLKSPNEHFDKMQRKLVQQYDRWCNEAEIILNAYLPEKNSTFQFYKNGNQYALGIAPTLQFLTIYYEMPKKREIVQEFNFKFDAQKNILLGLVKTIHLLPTKKGVSRSASAIATPAPQGNTTIFANRDVNFNSQPMNIDVNFQNFEQLRSIIQQCGEEQEITSKLLDQVDDLKNTQNTSNYVESFQKFLETAANSATVWTVLQPMIPFLMRLFQS